VELGHDKVSVKTFEERAIEQYADIRKMRIEVDALTNLSKTVCNYTSKYLPLSSFTSLSRTLHSCLPPSMLNKLEDYSVHHFNQLYSAILTDDGNIDLPKQKQEIVEEVKVVMDELKNSYNSRHLEKIGRQRCDFRWSSGRRGACREGGRGYGRDIQNSD
jgi:hypothetical protein